jgi:hypothetical protein
MLIGCDRNEVPPGSNLLKNNVRQITIPKPDYEDESEELPELIVIEETSEILQTWISADDALTIISDERQFEDSGDIFQNDSEWEDDVEIYRFELHWYGDHFWYEDISINSMTAEMTIDLIEYDYVEYMIDHWVSGILHDAEGGILSPVEAQWILQYNNFRYPEEYTTHYSPQYNTESEYAFWIHMPNDSPNFGQFEYVSKETGEIRRNDNNN